jgi:hypothetical protein
LSPNLLGRGDDEDTNAQGGFSASPSAYRLGEKAPSPNLLGRGDGDAFIALMYFIPLFDFGYFTLVLALGV